MTSKTFLQTAALCLILAAGICLRVHRTAGYGPIGVGYDEHVYSCYVDDTRLTGVTGYWKVIRAYEDSQRATAEALVHPLRIVYILTSYFWMQLFHVKSLAALHAVASLYGVLHLLIAGIFAWRVGGRMAALGVTALVACAPLQILLAQRALVDGVYACWVMICFWLLWENLRAPDRLGRLFAYTLALCLMVLTKEYAAFAFIGMSALIVANRWLRFGTVTPRLLAATVIGPALAVLVLILYAGGIGPFIQFYLTFVQKSQLLEYTIKCQDGPWSKYLLDFLLISPLVLLLAVGRIFQVKAGDRADLYCGLFLLICYVPMASVKGGMSLRFAEFWDLPLCWLAFSQLGVIAGKISAQRKAFVLGILTAFVCSVELFQYYRTFVEKPVYDPLTRNLLHAVDILKHAEKTEKPKN
jgi:4-amino-4-deoxy-L-arabinose transferase-like glycosyltransferase